MASVSSGSRASPKGFDEFSREIREFAIRLESWRTTATSDYGAEMNIKEFVELFWKRTHIDPKTKVPKQRKRLADAERTLLTKTINAATERNGRASLRRASGSLRSREIAFACVHYRLKMPAEQHSA